jgi:hypothetical protein
LKDTLAIIFLLGGFAMVVTGISLFDPGAGLIAAGVFTTGIGWAMATANE